MNEQSREHLSALLDGEADELNLRRLLSQADDASGLRRSWQHYHLISDVLHERPSGSGTLLADRVRAALDEEPGQQTTRWWQQRWIKPASHLAVAASFAAIVFVGGSFWLPAKAPATHSTTDKVADLSDVPGSFSTEGDDLVSAVSSDYSQPALPVSYSNRALSGAVPQALHRDHYVRLSSGLDDYLQRHEQRMGNHMSEWQLGWKPEGYALKSQDMSGDQQVMTYASNQGDGSFSVFIEPLGLKPRMDGTLERNGELVVARQLLSDKGDCFVTVAGKISRQVALNVIQNLTHGENE